MTIDHNKLDSILFPYSAIKRQSLYAQGGRFVHYTTADAAMKIIARTSFWMRNMRTMNDFSEIEYGHGELDACLLNPERKVRFIDALDGLGANTAQEIGRAHV